MLQRVQYNVHTLLFRENDIFLSARAFANVIKPGLPLKILSFGCSTGDELASLRFFFPTADIIGVDVDETVLKIARQNVGHIATVRFSDLGVLRELGPFDLVFALSSLCLNPLPGDIREHFKFEAFDGYCQMFDQLTSEQAILCFRNTSYLFKHSSVATKYDVVRSDIVESCGFVDVFDPTGGPILAQRPTGLGILSLLEGTTGIHSDWDLIDSIIVKRRDPKALPSVIHLCLSSTLPDGFEPLHTWKRSRAALVGYTEAERVIDFHEMFTSYSNGANIILEAKVERRFLIDGSHWVSLYTTHDYQNRDVSRIILGKKSP